MRPRKRDIKLKWIEGKPGMGEDTSKVMKVIENARELDTLMILFPVNIYLLLSQHL